MRELAPRQSSPLMRIQSLYQRLTNRKEPRQIVTVFQKDDEGEGRVIWLWRRSRSARSALPRPIVTWRLARRRRRRLHRSVKQTKFGA